MDYEIINILDLIESVGEEAVIANLSLFSCKNKEVEYFIKNNAVIFAKKKSSITYLIYDNNGRLAAIFTLAHKALEIDSTTLTKTLIRKIERFSHLDESSNNYTVSAFLIAQFGKNDNYPKQENISGNKLMDYTFEILSGIQHDIGGSLVYLECEEIPNLLNFYQNEENKFRIFGERISRTEKTKYIQLLKFI